MRSNEVIDFRNDFGAEAGAVEHAIVTGARLQMMSLHRGRQVLAQRMGSEGLPNPGDVVLLAFNGHQRHAANSLRIDGPATVDHFSLGERMIEEDCLDGLQIILGRADP